MSYEGVKWWTAKARDEKDIAKKIDALSCAIEEMADMKAVPVGNSERLTSAAPHKR